MRGFSKWISVALRVEIVWRDKESAGWTWFYGLKTSHDIGAAKHNLLTTSIE